jgi:hypothetical protein
MPGQRPAQPDIREGKEAVTTTRIRWAVALSMALGFHTPLARADDVIWRPVRKTPAQPAASLDQPVPLTQPGQSPATVTPVTHTEPAPSEPIIRAQAPDPTPPSPPPPAGPFIPNNGYDPGAPLDQPLHGPGFWDRCRNVIHGIGSGNGHQTFPESDHCFDDLGFISPVSNPFFFEDPRALTELRPLFIYQTAPNSTPIFRGGHSEFFGVQGRLAICERWSIVINKLGFVSLNPKEGDDVVRGGTGFAEMNIGPKWTFYRNEARAAAAAAGINFQLPIGSSREFQNTGNFAFDPYISYGKGFGRLPSGWGSFGFLASAGYSFGTDSKRSEFIHSSLHLDYDVGGLHRFYPLVETNWFHYTKAGRQTDLGFEGADLVNFGSSSLGGRDLVTIATGLRYKFGGRDNIQAGLVGEWAVTSQKDLQDFRLTLDFIFRY